MSKRVAMFVLSTLCLSVASAEVAGEEIAADIEAVLDRQLANWNAGDLDAFLDDYWKSPRLSFSSGGVTRRGFDATRRRYLAAYPTREKMGKTTFSKLEITPLGDEAALVLGHWRLERAGETLGGVFSLVFRKINGRWLIVHDHTSKKPVEQQAD